MPDSIITRFINPENAHVLRREGIVLLKLVMPFFVLVAIGINFHEFIYNAIAENIAINGLIIAAALYGVILIVIRLISAQMDFYVIERFGREALQGVYMPQLLEQPWLKRRYVRHYLGHIAKTGGTLASALQQNAIENELRTLNAEYEHKMELPQFIVGFMIAMGLLGTFIGLLTTLTGISSMLDGFGGSSADMDQKFMELVGQLRKPLAGMGIAFSASMFGLITSLMLAIMMINLRRYIGRVVACARNVMHDLTELGRGGVGAGNTAQLTPQDIASMVSGGGRGGDGSAGNSAIQDIMYQVNDANMQVANKIDGLTRKMDSLLQMLEASVNLTQKQNELLVRVVPRIGETNDKMLRELKEIATGQVEQNKHALMIVDANTQTAHAMDDGIKAQRETQASLTLSLRQIEACISQTNEKILKELKDIATSQVEQIKCSQMIVDVNRNATHAIGDSIKAQRETQAGLTVSLREVNGGLERIEERTRVLANSLTEVKEGFTKAGVYLGMAEAISNGIGQQTVLLETLVKEDRNLQKRLVSIHEDVRTHLALQGDVHTNGATETLNDFIP